MNKSTRLGVTALAIVLIVSVWLNIKAYTEFTFMMPTAASLCGCSSLAISDGLGKPDRIMSGSEYLGQRSAIASSYAPMPPEVSCDSVIVYLHDVTIIVFYMVNDKVTRIYIGYT